jgi:hypothetical protein
MKYYSFTSDGAEPDLICFVTMNCLVLRKSSGEYEIFDRYHSHKQMDNLERSRVVTRETPSQEIRDCIKIWKENYKDMQFLDSL